MDVLCYHIYFKLIFGHRYSIEKIPLYDSAEDEPSSKFLKIANSDSEYDIGGKIEYSTVMNFDVESEKPLESTVLSVQPLDSFPMEGVVMNAVKAEANEEMTLYSQGTPQSFAPKNAMISRIRSNSACRNYHIGSGPVPKKRSKQYSTGKLKHLIQKQVDAKHVTKLLAVKEAQEEVLTYEVWVYLCTCTYTHTCKCAHTFVIKLFYASKGGDDSQPYIHHNWFKYKPKRLINFLIRLWPLNFSQPCISGLH